MKKTMRYIFAATATLFITGSAMAAIVAYWETDLNTPDWYDSNIVTATSFKTGVTNDTSNWGSSDGTYGTLAGANTLTDGGFKGGIGDHMSTKLVNESGSQLRIDSLHFDFAKNFSGSVDSLVVTINGNPLATAVASGQLPDGARGDYEDFDYILATELGSEFILAAGASVTFQYAFTDSGSNIGNAGLDNIAIQATVVPEPATFALIAGFVTLGLVMVRRRARSSR